MSTSATSSRTWLVTGAGRGIGRAVVEAALGAGDRVAATVRDDSALADLREQHGDRLHVELLDVRDRAAAVEVVERVVAVAGGLDVVVNNAGFGLVGAIEEVSEDEARDILDTNLFGALWVTQAALPHLRARGRGHIVQISSVGGVGAMAFLGMYNASKWALEGFSEALAAEVAPFGVRVTIAELDGFDTDWSRGSMRFAAPSSDYDDVRLAALGSVEVPWDPGDPSESDEPPAAVAAASLLAAVDADSGPLRLLVGDLAPTYVSMALDARRVDYTSDTRFTWPAASAETRPGPATGSGG